MGTSDRKKLEVKSVFHVAVSKRAGCASGKKMGILRLYSLQKGLIILGLIIVPFISIGELMALFTGDLGSQTSNLTGVFKFSKDLIFILLILIGMVDYLIHDQVNRKALLYLFLVMLLVIPAFVLSMGSDLLYLAAGIRWVIPAVLPIFIFNAVDPGLLQKVSRLVFWLLLLHLILQLFQLVFAGAWFGTSAFGLNLRNPGFFLIPNTGAFFTVTCLYFGLFVSDFTTRKKNFLILISALSVFLTLSGTGLVVFLLLLFFYVARLRMVKWLVVLLPISIVFFFLFLEFLNARDENYVEQSGGTRLEIFEESFLESHLFSTDFGLGTNSAVLLGKGEIMDSTYASLVVNLGYWGFFSVLILITLGYAYALIKSNRSFFVFLVLFTLFGMTTIIYEVYPANLLMALLLVFFIHSGKKEQEVSASA